MRHQNRCKIMWKISFLVENHIGLSININISETYGKIYYWHCRLIAMIVEIALTYEIKLKKCRNNCL